MKKYVICLLAIVFAIATSSFSVVKKSITHKKKMLNYKWYDYNGGLLEMCDPGYYSLDPNNFPDCPPALGIIFCEIKALPNDDDPSLPDVTTIVESRYRRLL